MINNLSELFTILLRLTNNILSTGQQVWLQKLGGAKVPTLKLSDDTPKKEQPQIQKLVSEATIAKKKDANPTSDKPRQGERLERCLDLFWR